jgi:catechol 2,3-dioxygenase
LQLNYRACLASSSHADLDRLAIHYPTRAELADTLCRPRQAKTALEGASDHGVSEALYLRDPDQNGVELYWDRPREEWPRAKDGTIAMFTHPLDLEALLEDCSAECCA